MLLNQIDCRNRLLTLMSPQDFDLLAPSFDLIELQRGEILIEADAAIEHVYFPEGGVISLVAISPEGHEIEAGLFGREGAGPVPAFLGSELSPARVQAQIPDKTYRLPRTALTIATEASSSLHGLLLRFAQVLMVQTTFTALSNAVHPIEERLARWILMCHDRHDSNELILTHEFMSVMLAVRRPSVTTSLHVLEGNGFIRAERGIITVRNRKALEEFAGDAYGKPEAEYLRTIGPFSVGPLRRRGA